jgi:3-oxoacyl-[acyl-carrier protein] reductase
MLKGKIAVITGGSSGIGRAIVLKMAACGAHIAVIYYPGNQEQAEETCVEARTLGVRAEAYQCDVSDFAETKVVIDQIITGMGGLDILVNNAGLTRDKLVFNMKEEDYDMVVDTNLKGAFNTIKHCYAFFVKQRAGKIINISSVAGLTGNAGQANYAASKAGLIGLTKSVAKELAGRGICCNAIAPGFIATDMTAQLPGLEQIAAQIPLQRLGKPEDVAELAAFLASGKANYITGEVIRIDGGMAM